MSATIIEPSRTAPLVWRTGLAESGTPALARVGFGRGPDPCLPLTRLDGNLTAESWLTDRPPVIGEYRGFAYAAGEAVAFASLSLAADGDPAAAAEAAYRRLAALRAELGFEHLLRVWHYLDALNEGEGDDERYKRFCVGRARALDNRPEDDAGRMPAATVVGSDVPGLHLHCLLCRRAPTPVENPRQVSAYRYPRRYGPRRPAFARAARLDWPGGPTQLFLSGTASIVGHATRHAGDAGAQLRESLDNVAAVLRAAGGEFADGGVGCLDMLKVYLRDPADLPRVIEVLGDTLPKGLPWSCLRADLCRRDLLVEVEALATA